MDAAASDAFVANQGDSRHGNKCFVNIKNSPSSCTSSDYQDFFQESESDEEDDTLTQDALPIDKSSIEDELSQLRELETKLQADTAYDFLLGVEMLSAVKDSRVAKAHSNLERRHSAALKVFEYSEQKARESYSKSCAELQIEMANDFEKELRRLHTAKDGVSVTSRRRRAVRDESRGFSTPKAGNNGMRRRRNTYNNEEEDDGPEDVFYASASPEERAHRVQFQEKKRLERLLGSASIFTPVVRQVTAQEVAEDLETIRSAVPCTPLQLETTIKHKSKGSKEKPEHQKKLKKHKKKAKSKRRPVVVTPRRIPQMPQTIDGRLVSPRPSSVAENRRPRRHYNPTMLQEGQEVDVFRRKQRKASTDGEEEDECVLSGIITAATATRVYLLTATGIVESFDIQECLQGLLYIQAAVAANNGRREPTSASQ